MIKGYAAKVIQSQVIFLKTQLNGMRDDNDIEFLHHTRVMSRRIRSTLQVFGLYFGKKNSPKWYTSIQKLTKSLTKIRDLDVQIRFLEMQLTEIEQNNFQQGIKRLLLRKKQKRSSQQKKVLSIINTFEESKTLEDIFNFIDKHPFDIQTFYPPKELVDLARQKINDQLSLCFSYVPFITNPDNIREIHNLRISIKNLRYVVELFEIIYPELNNFLSVLKIFQDDLGRLHDDDIWMIDLDNFSEKEKNRIEKFYGQSGPINLILPGIEYLKKIIINDRKTTYGTFLDHWNFHFQDQFWSRLRDEIIEFPELDNKLVKETDHPEIIFVDPDNENSIKET